MVKYLVLIAIVVAAALGNLSLMILDPIALLTRASGTAVIPGVNWAILKGEVALYNAGLLQGQVDAFERALRGRVLPELQPVFQQAVPIFALLLVIVLLGLVADRFWCRYVCPLGALLGVVGRVAVLRPVVKPACNRCAACARICRVGAISVGERGEGEPLVPAGKDEVASAKPGASVVTAECAMCLDCLVACGRGGMTFGLTPRPRPPGPYDPGRRQFLAGAVAGGAGAVLLSAPACGTASARARLIRPPGRPGRETFLSRCLRCSQCMKVCPTSGLQPALDEAGLEGLWTPVLRPRLGYCDYGCNACGQVCPSGAIPRLDLEAKREQVLGLAFIDRDRCLPWATGHALHRLPGDVPGARQGDEAAEGEGPGPGRRSRFDGHRAAVRRLDAVHRLRHLRVSMSRRRGRGHPGGERGEGSGPAGDRLRGRGAPRGSRGS